MPPDPKNDSARRTRAGAGETQQEGAFAQDKNTGSRFDALRVAVLDARLRLEDVRVFTAILVQKLVTSPSGQVTCRASRERLAASSHVHPSSIRRCTGRLTDAGYIGKRGSTGRHPNIWTLCTLNPSNAARVDALNPSNHARVEASTDARVEVSENACNASNPARVGVPNPSNPAPQYLKQPQSDARKRAVIDSDSKSISVELDQDEARQQEKPSPAASRFPEFWKLYPKKVAGPAAERAWGRHKLNRVADKIIADLQARIADPEMWSDRKFIPNPATYLNNRRWLDEWDRSTAKPTAGTVTRNNATRIKQTTHAESQASADAALARLGGTT